MDRYCLEIDLQHKKVIIHDQRCAAYHDAHLLRMNLAQDLGEHPHKQTALRKARGLMPAAEPCTSCLRGD